jgi:hypothetical protein
MSQIESLWVLKIILEKEIVQVWDAAATLEQEIEEFWKVHAICALKIHVSDKVQKDELNILTNTEVRRIEKVYSGKHTPFVKEDNATWIVHGMLSPESYIQTDSYTCGPIAINRFASELKKIYDTLKCGQKSEDIDAEIMDKVKTPDELKDMNSQNAAELFKLLLATKMDAFDLDKEGDGAKDHDDGGMDNPIFMENPPVINLLEDESKEDKCKEDTNKAEGKKPPTHELMAR